MNKYIKVHINGATETLYREKIEDNHFKFRLKDLSVFNLIVICFVSLTLYQLLRFVVS